MTRIIALAIICAATNVLILQSTRDANAEIIKRICSVSRTVVNGNNYEVYEIDIDKREVSSGEVTWKNSNYSNSVMTTNTYVIINNKSAFIKTIRTTSVYSSEENIEIGIDDNFAYKISRQYVIIDSNSYRGPRKDSVYVGSCKRT